MSNRNIILSAAGAAGGLLQRNANYIGVSSVTAPQFRLLNRSSSNVITSVTTYTIGLTQGRSIKFSQDGSYIGHSNIDSPRFRLLNRPTASTLSYASTYASITPASVSGVDHLDSYGDYFALAGSSSPYFQLLQNTSGTVTSSATYTLSSAATGTQFSPDGKTIAIVNSNRLTLLDHSSPGSVTYLALATLPGTGYGSIQFSPAGDYIAVGHSTTYFSIYSISGGSLTLQTTYNLGTYLDLDGESTRNREPYTFSFTDDNTRLAITHQGNTVNRSVTLFSTTLSTVTYLSRPIAFTSERGGKFILGGDYFIAIGTGGEVEILSFNGSSFTSISTYTASPAPIWFDISWD